jgi:hypothetical protein
MSEPAQTPAAESPPALPKSTASDESGGSSTIVVTVCGLLIIAAIGIVARGAYLRFGPTKVGPPTLSFVAQRDISEALETLTPATAAILADDAKECRIPLVLMTVARGTAAIGSTFRIRSGNYTSPTFTVTANVQRFAMPFPAPYGSGAGAFIVEGNAKGALLGLTPAKALSELPGTQAIPVVWRAVTPC